MLAVLLSLVTGAAAQDFQSPNALVGVGAGVPWVVSVRGEAWYGAEVSMEGGVGTGVVDIGGDWALRWRPRFACFGCTTQNLVTLGLGVGGLVLPQDGPWELQAGVDLAGTFVHWFTPSLGLYVGVRGGVGPTWAGTAFGFDETGYYALGSAGLAF